MLQSYFISKGVPAGEVELITEAFKPKSFPKGSHFAEEGKTSKYLAFVTKGLFQYYFLKDGKEITTYVSGANSFVASLSSFYKQKPGKEYIKALIDSDVFLLHYNDLTRLKKESEGFRHFYIDALEDVITGIDETRSNLIALTAEERYSLLLKEEPALLQQIPLQYLATILGVTPRHLSRIRTGIPAPK